MALFKVKPWYKKRNITPSYYGSIRGIGVLEGGGSDVMSRGTLQIGVSLDTYAVFQTSSSSTPHYIALYDASLTYQTFNALFGYFSGDGAAATHYTQPSNVVINYMLVAGNSNSSAEKRVYLLNSSLSQSQLTSLTNGRGNIAAAACNGLVLFAGGSNNNGSLSDVDVYTYTTRGQSKSIQYSRYNMAASVVDNTYFIFAGGEINISNYKKYVDAFNMSLTRTNTNLPQEVTRLCAGNIGRYSIFTGGYNRGYDLKTYPINSIYVFDSSLTLSTKCRSVATYRPAIISIGNYVLIGGGTTGENCNQTPSKIMEMLDTSLVSTLTDPLNNYSTNCAGASIGNYAIINSTSPTATSGSGSNASFNQAAEVYQLI